MVPLTSFRSRSLSAAGPLVAAFVGAAVGAYLADYLGRDRERRHNCNRLRLAVAEMRLYADNPAGDKFLTERSDVVFGYVVNTISALASDPEGSFRVAENIRRTVKEVAQQGGRESDLQRANLEDLRTQLLGKCMCD